MVASFGPVDWTAIKKGIGVSAVALMAVAAWAAEPKASDQPSRDLTELSVEDLMNLKVTLVSKSPKKVSESAAAIYVITQDDIRRSGVTSVPEALRLAPGMQVGRVDSHNWAVSARGFNDIFANKLLVLQDGRSIYTPLFSGVFWDVQDTLLEDIDRIEVIRGPGATLWGANAVNGVINIITKRAADTQGVLVTGGGGTEELGFAGLRYGAKLGENVSFRIYGKYFNRDDSVLPSGTAANDDWQMGRGGFRIDWQASDINLLTFQGDLYGGKLDQTYTRAAVGPPFAYAATDTIDVAGGNLLGRWTHTFSADSDLSLQTYYDRTYRDTVIFKEDRHTFDLDLSHRFPLGERQNIIWGAGYRATTDDVRNSYDVSLNPDNRTTHLVSAFVQDEISLIEKRLVLTLGTKLEHNDFTGFEIQPSGRLLWTPHDRHTVWASVSRAVRTPSRAEDDLRLNQPGLLLPPGSLGPGFPPVPTPLVTSVFGSRSYGSEELLAYELGYRVQLHDRLSLDLTGFYNVYENLRSVATGGPYFELAPPPPHLVVPVNLGNNLSGETYGAEAAANCQLTDWWRWRVSYTFLQIQLHPDLIPGDTATERSIEGGDPHHVFSVRSMMDLPHNVELDGGLRYVDSLPGRRIKSYVAVDVRLAWRPTKNWELAIVGQNLLDNQHPEFTPTTIATQVTEVQHSVYGKVTWRF